MEKQTNIYSPAHAVSEENKTLGFWDLYTLLFSFGVGLAVIQAGAVVSGITGSMSYIAIILGSIVGSFFLAIVGTIGAKTGLSSMASTRVIFGSKTSYLPTILNILQLLGWGSFVIIIVRESILFLIHHYHITGIVSSYYFWSFLIPFIAMILAIAGPLSIIRIYLKRLVVWIILLSSLWLTIVLVRHHPQLSSISGQPSFSWGSFFKGCDLVISMAFSYLPIIGDYTRFGQTPKKAFFGTFLGYAMANAWLMSLGAAFSLLFTQSSDTHALILCLATAAGGLPLFCILINETDNIFIDIHSSSLSISLFTKLPVRLLCIVVALICIMISLWVDIGKYENFLVAIGSVFAPLFGVILAEYCSMFKKNRNFQAYAPKMVAVSWLIGICIFYLCYFMDSVIGSAIPALVSSFIIQWISIQVATKKG